MIDPANRANARCTFELRSSDRSADPRQLLACGALLLAACTGRAHAVIGGEPSARLSGVARVVHVMQANPCSGVLIADELVLTSMHCARATDSGALLPPAGFQVNFGESEDAFVRRTVKAVALVDDAGSIDEAVASGTDVVVLRLDAPAPPDQQRRDVDLAFTPNDRQEVALAGFGISDVTTGANGVRRLGRGRLTGFDPDSGVVQIDGDSMCFGDSGGPVLSPDLERVLGVLGQVGGSQQNRFCDIGLSFAATAANARVQRLIARQCAGVGGCGPRRVIADAGDDDDSSVVDEPDPVADASSAVDVDAARDAEAPSDEAGAPPDDRVRPDRGSRSAASCTLAYGIAAAPPPPWPALLGLAWLGGCVARTFTRRSRRRRRIVHSTSWSWLALVVLLVACGDDGEGDGGRDGGDAGADARIKNRNRSDSGPPRAGQSGNDGLAGEGGEGGRSPMAPSDAGVDGAPNAGDAAPQPHPVSEYCGDAIRDPQLEECDDGPGEDDDGCTETCRVRTVRLVEGEDEPDAGRSDGPELGLGTGPHVAAGLDLGFAVTYMETGSEPAVFMQAHGEVGDRLGPPINVALDAAPIDAANPVVAALPDNVYAVAWTDGSSGAPDIALRLVDGATGELGALHIAHDATGGFQQDPDVLWTGDELIVAFTNLLDVRYRAFDRRLRPLGDLRTLGASPAAIESSVALARFDGTLGGGLSFQRSVRSHSRDRRQSRVVDTAGAARAGRRTPGAGRAR